MEFDCYQHYFMDDFDTEEDFYKSTAPSEDIWKKFELLPTPPMSPTRTLSATAAHLSPGDKLSWLTKVLGQDEDYEGQFIPDSEKLFGNLSSIIIQDCMWSSFSASKQLEKVSGRVAAAAPVTQISVRPGKAHCVSPCAQISASVADCVDPAAVLTIPSSSCRKSASSGSESRSDSSDDDDDDEEIDVVTVESKQNRVRLVNVRKPVTITVRADPCPKRFHMSVHRQQHNYAARSPDSEPEPEDDDDDEEEEEEEEEDDDEVEYEEEPQSKRVCTATSQRLGSSPQASQPSSPLTSPPDSDTDDTDRRRNHNFLERKRSKHLLWLNAFSFAMTDDDDDDEEIDVVTVESKQNRVRLVNVRKPVTITVRADPCPKRFHMSVHRQQHNYAARSPDSEPEPEDDDDDEEEEEEEEEDDDEVEYEEEPQSKRVCTATSQRLGSSPQASQPSSPLTSPPDSDTDDTDRRRNHNFLERKRRNDLRSRFLALRDQIPGLESSKTPKVAILTQATEYLTDLHRKEKQQLLEKKRLRSRQQQLLRRLSELKRS
ncbi:protein L-Myc-1b [Cynoglossus semilaevis]|uniref:protein L-Myc-1b n=1 Tax=Cynoglossus semilaevis TaxID=244447 RepID=UPI003D91E331